MHTRCLPLLMLLVFLLIRPSTSEAQELNMQVTVNTPKLQTADPKVFKDLERGIQEFFNNQKWTDDEFETEERIDCQIQLTITEELSATAFRAELAIQSSRPVFKSNYQSVLFSHIDKQVEFTYQQFQPLQFTENSYIDNLSAILSFYAYIILAIDYDSFSPLGGDPYYQKARDILNNVPRSAAERFKGWLSKDGDRSRFVLIENALNSRILPLRQAFYDYHRKSLDLMFQDPEAGKTGIQGALSLINTVNRDYPNSMSVQLFCNAKANEIIEIFKAGNREQKKEVRTIMTRLDASNAAKYQGIGN